MVPAGVASRLCSLRAWIRTLNPAPGTFLADVIVYKSGAAPPQLGQRLQIRVKSAGTGRVDVDNVSTSLPRHNSRGWSICFVD